MKEKKFFKGEAIRFGWETTIRNLGFFIVLIVIWFLIGLLGEVIASLLEYAGVMGVVFWMVIMIALEMIMYMGLIRICLKFVDDITPSFGDLFACAPLFFKYLLSSILYALIVIVGFILLIIPGIILAIAFCFYSYFIVDKEVGPIEALKRSWQITKGAKWDIFLLCLLLLVINILGLLAFVIGLLVTIPIAWVAFAYVYRQLSLEEEVMIENKIKDQRTPITITHEKYETPPPISFFKEGDGSHRKINKK